MATAEWEHSSCITMDAVADLGLIRYVKISRQLSVVNRETDKLPTLQHGREVDKPSLSQRRLSGYFVSSESFPNVSVSRRRSSKGGLAKGPGLVGSSCTLHAKDVVQKRKDVETDNGKKTTLPLLVTHTRKNRQNSNGCPRLLGWPRYRRERSNRIERPQYSFRIKSNTSLNSSTADEAKVDLDRSVHDEKTSSTNDVSATMSAKEKTESVVNNLRLTKQEQPVLSTLPTQRRTNAAKIEKQITKHTVHPNFTLDILPREKLPSPSIGAYGKTTQPVVQRNLHIRLPDIYERQRTLPCRSPSGFGSWQVSREEDDDD